MWKPQARFLLARVCVCTHVLCTCVYMCVFVCIFICVHARVYVCMCGSLRQALNAFTRLLSVFVLEIGFLIEPVVLIVSAGLATWLVAGEL